MSFSFLLKVNCFWDLRRHLLAIKLPRMEIAPLHVSDDEPSSSAELWSCIRDSATLQGFFNCGFELCGRREQKTNASLMKLAVGWSGLKTLQGNAQDLQRDGATGSAGRGLA